MNLWNTNYGLVYQILRLHYRITYTRVFVIMAYPIRTDSSGDIAQGMCYALHSPSAQFISFRFFIGVSYSFTILSWSSTIAMVVHTFGWYEHFGIG